MSFSRPLILLRLRRSLALTLFLPALVAFGAAPAGWSQSSIRIVVNDHPITSYDVQNRTQMLKTFSRGRQGEKDAIDQLVDETLMLQEAKRRGVQISEAEVDAEFASRARAAQMSPAQFAGAMRQAGIDTRTFKDFLRANMAWTTIVRGRFRATVSVSEQEVAAALTGRDTEEADRVTTEYQLQQIIFVVPRGAGNAVVAQKRQEAAAFRSTFEGCERSLQQAGGTPGVVIRPPSRREESDLPEEMKAELAAMQVGDLTQPETVPDGIQLIAVCAKNEIAGQTEAEVEARREINSERGQLLARRYLRDLRSDAVIEYR